MPSERYRNTTSRHGKACSTAFRRNLRLQLFRLKAVLHADFAAFLRLFFEVAFFDFFVERLRLTVAAGKVSAPSSTLINTSFV